jgi:hypothetical protein
VNASAYQTMHSSTFRDLRFVEMGRTQGASHMTVRERSMMIDECSLLTVQ